MPIFSSNFRDCSLAGFTTATNSLNFIR